MIKNECCIQGMRKMDGGSVDLIVTDPPYLIDYQSAWRTNKFEKIENDIDGHKLIKEFLKEAYRVLKDDTAIYMFCSWHHVDFFKQEFERHFRLKNILIWNKNNHGSGDLKGSYAPKYELVLFGHKGRHKLNKRIPDVINCQKVNVNNMSHPTEKPVNLLEIFISNSSTVGGLVFDPFSGTGSTGVASANLQRKFIGFELNENYCEIGNARINKALQVTQLRLF